MFALKIVAFSALVFCAHAESEADQIKWIMECGKKAIENGVPELNIPSHNPYKFTKDIAIWWNTTNLDQLITIKNLVWTNASEYEFESVLKSSSKRLVIFDVTLTWNNFSLVADTILSSNGDTGIFSVIVGPVQLKGTLWVQKPNRVNPNFYFVDASLVQSIKNYDIYVPKNYELGVFLMNTIRDALANFKFTDDVLDFLNAFSQKPERTEALVKWCKSQGL